MDDSTQNTAVGKRLRQFREYLKIPRTRFALAIGFSSESVASYESGRVPLPYAVYVKIVRFFPLDPVWLATGKGTSDWEITLEFPDAAKLGVRQTARFIDVFNNHLETILSDSDVFLSDTHMDVEWRRTHEDGVLDAINECYTKLPQDRIKPITQLLLDTLKKAILESPDDAKSILKRRIFRKHYDLLESEQMKKKGVEAFAQRVELKTRGAKGIMLPHLTTSSKMNGVNHWHRLKAQIQKATEIPGGRSMLAKFLGVDLTHISRWLSKTGPEPGADYALKMLQWVQERESKQ